jgi:hypothetical protein
MLIAGLSPRFAGVPQCVCAAVVMAALGLWSLSRCPAADTNRVVMRSVAPPQLAAAVMLAAVGTVALAAPQNAALQVVPVCLGVSIVGAVGTVAVGSWQSARYVLRRDAAGCGSTCGTCTLACR